MHGSLDVRLPLLRVAPGEGHELRGVLEPPLPQQRIGEAPVDLRGEPAALRERKGKRFAQALR